MRAQIRALEMKGGCESARYLNVHDTHKDTTGKGIKLYHLENYPRLKARSMTDVSQIEFEIGNEQIFIVFNRATLKFILDNL